ncbi:single-stranded-DNA-specific exonuclease RecJ [Candidatus Saccharibacteria bacterium]|nr:single-stranded-DNA-specific exonuclease RecJ [Candidatus Saccharibacteria bacterium]
MTDIFRRLLARRGLDEDFLRPKYEDLFDPFLMQGMRAAVRRIEKARDQGERVVVFGDYDADGVTASVVMYEALRSFGCEDVEVILPDRFVDGYGLGESAEAKVLAAGATLVVTVDNGSGSEAVIARLKQEGIETIVTDHHQIPQLPQSAVAVINPQRADERYGKKMAGVGVAFCVARALNATQNGGECDGQEKWLLDLVVIGTICDSMVLRDENRILSYFGMLVLSKTRRVGLKELAKTAGVQLASLDTHVIGFQLGPRINAAGRLKSAELALRLLMAKHRDEAFLLAQELEALNQERRRMQDVAAQEIAEQYRSEERVLVMQGAWHEGVVGIIAGQAVEKYHKPAFALTEVGGGVVKGSGRSFGEFSLAQALEHCRDCLIGGGGHALACGITLRTEAVDDLRHELNEYYDSLGLKAQEKYLVRPTDLELDNLKGIDLTLYDEISQLAPFGEGNEEPLFEIRVRVVGRRLLKERHLALTVADDCGNEMKMMAFYAPEEWLAVRAGDELGLQFSLTKNEWRGVTKIEATITDLKQI